ncbi:Serralysin C [Tepidimonas fonticaldi]|uniref:Serralysin C n=1 Tax=Tepidimonas fonticaldi TaxID=1101373 RepID=A0A554XHR6_9BURK|nr:DUF4214 domain-containing protein [Tepidimonas fonticaldi]TSE35329.1 Serralysin C [Tepidimonas fonticaldi]
MFSPLNSALSPQQRLKLIELYIGYFNRAPEQAGLDYWSAQLDSALARGVGEQAALAGIANQFYQAGLQYGLFRASDSTETLIRTVYRNVLGRDEVDPAGLAYWQQRLDSGQISRGEFVLALIQGAKDYVAAAPANDPYRWVGDYLASRSAVGEYFAATSGGLAGQDAITQGRQIIERIVTRDQALAGQTALDALNDAVHLRQPSAASLTATLTGMEPILPRTAAPVTWLDYKDAGGEYEWSGKTLTVSFPGTIPPEHATAPDWASGWASVPVAWRTAWFRALQDAMAPVGVKLELALSGAGDIQIVLGNLQNDFAGWANHPGPGIGGDIQIRTDYAQREMGASPLPTYSIWNTLVHELGHALGLKHPFDDSPTMPPPLDSQYLSIMSYTHARDVWPVVTWGYTPSSGIRDVSAQYQVGYRADWALVDLAALMAMYGPSTAHHAGNTVHHLPAPSPQTWLYRTVSDASGHDTLDLRSFQHPSRIDLRPGSLSDVDVRTPQDWKQDITAQAVAYYQQLGIYNASVHDWIVRYVNPLIDRADVLPRLWSGIAALGIADGTVIESLLLGPANDTVHDNAVDNTLHTGAGDDTVYLGAGGWDRIDGGEGIDIVVLPSLAADVITLPASQSAIVVAATYGAVLDNVEYLADRSGAWRALDATLVGVPPRLPAWVDWTLDNATV